MAADPPPDLGKGVPVQWVDGVPTTTTGAAFGVPWPKGQVARDTDFSLEAEGGSQVPVQSWALAYWPDGSLKWTGHALGADAGRSRALTLRKGTSDAPAKPVTVRSTQSTITLDNGVVTVALARSGATLLQSMSRGGRVAARNGELVLLLQNRPDDLEGQGYPDLTSWTGTIDKAEVEQQGPVRSVVKLTGRYEADHGKSRGGNGGRAVLPWTVRVYLTAGAESASFVHSFIWDGDMERDFVRGLGLRVDVPLQDATYDRHVRFASASGGVWGEPVRVLTGLRRDPGAAVDKAQVDGTATPPLSTWNPQVSGGYTQLAEWNDYTLFQESASHYAIWKRTSEKGSWLKHAAHGERASGFGYVGGVSGGLGFGMRDFWQQFPRSLDIRGAAGDTASVTLWSWSPLAGAMDLRHYDTTAHGLDLAYEDVQPGFSTPEGIARSTELQLWALASTPSRDRVAALGGATASPPQPFADPRWHHQAGVFGRWGLPDRSTPGRARLEDSISADLAFFADQIDQRGWYGFWDYGDVMHTYDNDRHEWRYDAGGFAWDNAELGADAALWYAFLRSGDPLAFRLAQARTRHVAEVDTHHTGRFAGLGSRHNVSHWGDGAKEARVGESYTRRFAYYLTADELIGDWMHLSLQADTTLMTVEPLREVLPPQHVAPTRLRIGPDWYALVSNWLTEWERTGDTKWRDRIVTGMRDIASFPAGLFTGEGGGAVGFDPTTAHLVNLNKGDYTGGNLAMAFCGDQVMFETVELVDVPEFRQTLLDFARYVQAPSAEKIAHYGFDFKPPFPTIYSRVTAWAGEQLDDASIRRRGWQQFLSDPAGQPWATPATISGTLVPEPVKEIRGAATNDAAQRTLAIIELLGVAPEEAP